MGRVTFLVAVLAVAPFSAATAQEPPPLKVGDRVRVTAPNLGINKRTGVLQVVGDDTLVVDTMRLALASMTRLEVSRGWKRHTGKGVEYGLVLGLVAGGFVGANTYERAATTAAACLRLCAEVLAKVLVAKRKAGATAKGQAV